MNKFLPDSVPDYVDTKHLYENLMRYKTLLSEWNRVHNLSGAKSDDEIDANIRDSLIPIGFVSAPESMLDVGTGAGFPGLLLAMVWGKSSVTLCESLKKRAAFLKYVCADLGLSHVKVESKRVETLRTEPFALITSRAVTDTKMLLSLTQKVADANTRYLFYKGSRVFDETDVLKHQFRYDIVQREKGYYLYIKGRQ